jgi:alkylhydroperoxidase family enzyme
MRSGVEVEQQERVLQALETSDWDHVDDPVHRAALAYAIKLTRSPSLMVEEDVQILRNQGMSDRAIHDLCSITAYFAFVNRIADGLGVELESTDQPE